jgi:hypothetical protein
MPGLIISFFFSLKTLLPLQVHNTSVIGRKISRPWTIIKHFPLQGVIVEK